MFDTQILNIVVSNTLKYSEQNKTTKQQNPNKIVFIKGNILFENQSKAKLISYKHKAKVCRFFARVKMSRHFLISLSVLNRHLIKI